MLTEEKLKDLAALYTCSPSMSRARRNSLCARVQRQQQEQRWRDDERRDAVSRARVALVPRDEQRHLARAVLGAVEYLRNESG
jgi:hypothetical protein